MSSPIQKSRRQGRRCQAMTKKVNLNSTRMNESAAPFLLASLTADAELMKTPIELVQPPPRTKAAHGARTCRHQV